MGQSKEKSLEPAPYKTDSGPRQGQVTNLGDIVTVHRDGGKSTG